jgi:AcrR family transcriptional regulator
MARSHFAVNVGIAMTPEKRKYQMTRRAETQVRTREQIIASTASLHATIGPAETTMSAIADHAGVPRSTVYRHFEDDAALIVACATHWQLANPPPPLEPWAAIDDPELRLARALRELYAYYRRAGSTMENVMRDEAAVPVLTDVLGRFRGYLAAAQEILMAGRSRRGAARRRTRAAIGHALAYTTWQSLTRDNQLADAESAALMARLAAAAGVAGTPRPGSRK